MIVENTRNLTNVLMQCSTVTSAVQHDFERYLSRLEDSSVIESEKFCVQAGRLRPVRNEMHRYSSDAQGDLQFVKDPRRKAHP
jgi:hypothetical protein